MNHITTLTGLSQATAWFDLTDVQEDFALHVVVTGSLTLGVQVSNDENGSSTKSDEYTIETLTASAAKQYSRPLPKFMRIKVTGYVNGNAVVSVWPSLGRGDLRIEVSGEARERD